MDKIPFPKLVGVDVVPFQAEGQQLLRIASRDRLSDHWLPLRREAGILLQYMNGKHAVPDIRSAVARDYGVDVAAEVIAQLVAALDEICVLDTPRYRNSKRAIEDAFRKSTVREPTHAGGAYESDPQALHKQLQAMFEGPAGPGTPGPCRPEKGLRAVFAPHIDYRRGGSSFAWAFKELAEQSDAKVFVLVGTSHYSSHRFILTRKDFRTPLGIAKTNREFVDVLARECKADVFADELAHKPEHSLELHVLFLQYLFNHRRDFSIVPLLVGSFHDAVEENRSPSGKEDIAQMTSALRRAESECGENVCYVVSGDLAHIGMKFGDPWQVDADRSAWCRNMDMELLESFASGCSASLFEFIASEKDGRRICGFPPGYTMLQAVQPEAGKVLCYDQFVDPRGFEIVSFASLAFYDRRNAEAASRVEIR